MRCIKPYKTKQYGFVPCGSCFACKQRATNQWIFRLMQEDRRSESSHFITLTYDEDHLQRVGKKATLRKRDLQNFFKRLRRYQAYSGNEAQIKYYAVGEYGSKSHRPHYHAIVFNSTYELIEKAWTLKGKPIGGIYFGDVRESSIAYTMKYMVKPERHRDIRKFRKWSTDPREYEFAVMSKNIGSNYVTDEIVRWHSMDVVNRNFVRLGNVKIALPRYYRDKIFNEFQKQIIALGGSLISQDDFNRQFKKKDYQDYVMKFSKAVSFAQRTFNSKQKSKIEVL